MNFQFSTALLYLRTLIFVSMYTSIHFGVLWRAHCGFWFLIANTQFNKNSFAFFINWNRIYLRKQLETPKSIWRFRICSHKSEMKCSFVRLKKNNKKPLSMQLCVCAMSMGCHRLLSNCVKCQCCQADAVNAVWHLRAHTNTYTHAYICECEVPLMCQTQIFN